LAENKVDVIVGGNLTGDLARAGTDVGWSLE